MAKNKKSKNSDIEKLRMILDSPSDPKIKKILDKHEKNLNSILNRLSEESLQTKPDIKTKELFKKSDDNNLEPSVSIHENDDKTAIPSEISPEINELEEDIEEFQEVEDEDVKFEDNFEDLSEDEELFEVEKIKDTDNEFLEIKPKEKEEIDKKNSEIFFDQVQTEEGSKDEELVPEWEPVKDKQDNNLKEFTEFKQEENEDKTDITDDKNKEDHKYKEFTEYIPDKKDNELEAENEDITESSKDQEFSEIKENSHENQIQTKNEQKKFTVVDSVETGQYKIQDTENTEDIQTWEPINLDKDVHDIKKEEKEQNLILEESSKKSKKKSIFPKFSIINHKSKDKEDKKKIRGEKKLKKLEKKEAKRKEKEKELEIKKSEDEKNRMLFTKEQELKQKEKEEEKQKKIKTKKDQKLISELVADDEGYQKDVIPKSDLKAQQIKSKQEQKEKEAKTKAKIKEDKKLDQLREKELKKQKKLQRKKEKVKKAEQKTPELVDEEKLTISKNIKQEETTEWDSYDAEEVNLDEQKEESKYYTHGDFTLYKKEIKTVTGKNRVVHFFSKKKPDVGEPVQLPEGYEVKVNKRTELPYLKKKN